MAGAGTTAARSSFPEMTSEVTLYIGGVHAADQPTVVKTVLGSCVAVCLWDPATGVGGMNHFMLPNGDGGAGVAGPTRFGVHAMDCLIGAIMKLGGDRRRLVAKCFGGGHVLDMGGGTASVAQLNIDFIRAFLQDERLAVQSQDLGGLHARHVRFHTDSGRAFVKRISGPRATTRLLDREQRATEQAPQFGDVTLF